MKIAVTVPADISDRNGTSIRAEKIYNILKEEYNVKLIHSDSVKFDNLFIIFIDAIRWNIKLFRALLKGNFDIVYLSSDWLSFGLVNILSKFRDFKIIFDAHGIISEENIQKNRNIIIVRLCQFLEKFVISRSDYVITLSEKIFKFYKNYNQKIDLVTVLADTHKCSIKKRHINRESRLVGLIGPFDMPANKFSLNFLYNNLHKFDDSINFLIIGKCEKKVKSSKISYTGYIESEKEYIEKLCSLDALLVISNISTSGPQNKIIESMSCGVPVFTTPLGIVGLDHIKNLENILFFEEMDLIQQLNKYIFQDELMLEISNKARNIVKEHYDKTLNEKKLMNIVEFC